VTVAVVTAAAAAAAISHLFYPEYNRKIEVSKVKNCTYLLLIYSKV
jgi:hypothetical protein